jgi:hypothetical protein
VRYPSCEVTPVAQIDGVYKTLASSAVASHEQLVDVDWQYAAAKTGQ